MEFASPILGDFHTPCSNVFVYVRFWGNQLIILKQYNKTNLWKFHIKR